MKHPIQLTLLDQAGIKGVGFQMKKLLYTDHDNYAALPEILTGHCVQLKRKGAADGDAEMDDGELSVALDDFFDVRPA